MVQAFRRRIAPFLLLVTCAAGVLAAPEPATTAEPPRVPADPGVDLAGPSDSTAETGPAAADGVLFSSGFDGPGAPGLVFDREGVWSVVDGTLRAELPDRRHARSFAHFGSEDWTDVAIEVDVQGERGVDKGVAIRVADGKGIGIDLRGGSYNDIVVYRGYTKLGRAPAPNQNGEWHRLRIEVEGGRYRVWVDGALKLEVLDPENDHPRGRVALAAYTGGAGACALRFDNLVVRRLGN